VLAASARPARAEPPADADAAPSQPDEVIEIRGHAPTVGETDERAADRRRALAETAFVSRVALDDRAGEQVALPEVLAESVGVAVRSLGGLGGFATVSVRGAAPGHTQVVLDGVPLSRLGSATVDLGRLELAGFSTVELYRGGAPGHLGGAAGSTLHLVSQVGPPADGRRLRLAAGFGSFGARSLAARYLGGDDALGWLAAAAYGGARGDFPYFDDRGTNLTTADDRTATRRGAGHDAVEASARVRRAGRLALDGGARTSWRDQGVPGPGNAQASRASLGTVRQTVDGSARLASLAGGRLALGATAYGLIERQRFRDPAAEIGVGAQDRRTLTLAAGTTAGLDAALAPWQRAAATVELRGERYVEDDLAVGERAARGRRLGAALELADELGGARAVIRPSLRLEAVRTRPPPDRDDGTGPAAVAARDDRVVAPRLGARVALGHDVALKAGLARYVRLPTALELFGDRGVIVGNPGLGAERGWSGEVGAVAAPLARHGALDRIELEAVLFASRSSDTIALVPTAALVVAPQNLGGARVLGGELSAAGRLAGALTLLARYTAMHTRQVDTLPSYVGKELPHRPRHRLYARAELALAPRGRAATLWSDLELTAGNHLDPANLDQVPRRQLVGAGATLAAGAGLLVGVEVENLLDERIETIELDPPPRPDLARVPRAIADFYGYPLPGRAFYLTIRWET
jgi:iron complex outermembrane receptor protein